MKPLNLLFEYYTRVSPNRAILELCGVTDRDVPYTNELDDDLTVIVNAWARPEFLPLIWEAIQYQSRRPKETWIVQNNPGTKAEVPRAFLQRVRDGYNTVIFDSGLNHGCWFRFILAAIACRTRFVAIYDDDTLSGRMALSGALDDMARAPGIYGGRGITFNYATEGPEFSNCTVSGWSAGTEKAQQVDFVGHLWVMETYWLRALLSQLPDLYLSSPNQSGECGEDMYVSFIGQQNDVPTFVFGHGARTLTPRWSSLQGYKMGVHQNAMFKNDGLKNGDKYLKEFVGKGWRLLRYDSKIAAGCVQLPD
ncbi:MAG: hypothetical protein WB609_10365 [Candidatus Cybelea sp.]